jgi:lipopolysaccharide/colanic/teichoic acid biosynthesis glycosyltransferase
MLTSNDPALSGHDDDVPKGPRLFAIQGGGARDDERDASEATRRVTTYERFFKPLIDRTVGTALLLAVLPTLLLVALAVRALLGRSVVFKQRRVGRGGRVFTMYKFRTMHPCRRSARCRRSTPRPHAPDRRLTHKHPQDPRLTPLGRFLRKWSLDELPQLWNVARGDMSLIGPRPELVDIVDRYESWQHERHAVRPGLTGLWQVLARGDGPMHENTHLDLAYVRQVRFTTDCKILLHTIPVLMGRRTGF